MKLNSVFFCFCNNFCYINFKKAFQLRPVIRHTSERHLYDVRGFLYIEAWCSPDLVKFSPGSYSRSRHDHYFDQFHYFSFIIPRCHKDVSVNSFFPLTAKFWNSLPGECFPLTYNLNGFKSKIYWLLYLWALSIQFSYKLFIFVQKHFSGVVQ